MISKFNFTVLMLTLSFVMLSLVAVSSGSGEERVVKKLRYPEYDEQGRLKFELMGDEATIRKDGLIQIVNLVMHLYEDGEVVMSVFSPICLYDRDKQTAASTSTVAVTRAELSLTGRGFEWAGAEGGFKIHEDVKMILNTDLPDSDEEKKEK